MKQVEKIYFESTSGAKTIVILKTPVTFPVFYAIKYKLIKDKKYFKISPIWKD